MAHLIVTGGGGFAMAHVVRAWLERAPENRVSILEASPLDAAAERFFADVRDRIALRLGDVADPASFEGLGEAVGLVHGAAVTPHTDAGPDGALKRSEAVDPVRVIATNVLGATAAFDWARRQPRPPRVVYISSGSVYARSLPEDVADRELIREDRHVAPEGLYDVGKHAAELILRRFGVLYGLEGASLRLSSVFGALDRHTAARKIASMAKLITERAVAGLPLRVASPEAAGDFVSAPDVAQAVIRVIAAPAERLRHPVYNVADGRLTTLAQVARMLEPVTGPVRLETVGPAEAEIGQLAGQRSGRYGAYDVTRIADDLGWRPRLLAESFQDYARFLMAERAAG